MSELHNIRTISQLDNFPISNIGSISSDNICFEISKQDTTGIQTYNINAKDFIDAIIDETMSRVYRNFVTLSGDPQTITSNKVFNSNLSCLKNIVLSSNDITKPLLSCNSPINGIAMSAWWA